MAMAWRGKATVAKSQTWEAESPRPSTFGSAVLTPVPPEAAGWTAAGPSYRLSLSGFAGPSAPNRCFPANHDREGSEVYSLTLKGPDQGVKPLTIASPEARGVPVDAAAHLRRARGQRGGRIP